MNVLARLNMTIPGPTGNFIFFKGKSYICILEANIFNITDEMGHVYECSRDMFDYYFAVDMQNDARLTKRNPYGIERVCHRRERKDPIGCYGCVDRAKCNADILEKLTQYEDTGLTPEEIKLLLNSV